MHHSSGPQGHMTFQKSIVLLKKHFFTSQEHLKSVDFTLKFDQFNASIPIQSINFFQNKSFWPQLLNSSVYQIVCLPMKVLEVECLLFKQDVFSICESSKCWSSLQSWKTEQISFRWQLSEAVTWLCVGQRPESLWFPIHCCSGIKQSVRI